MSRSKFFTTTFLVCAAFVALPSNILADSADADGLHIGWASADITPEQPVVLTGFSRARVSAGVLDPITATALVLDSVQGGKSSEKVVMISLDLIGVSNDLRDQVREKVSQSLPEIDPNKVMLNATHTHCAPETRTNTEMAAKLGELGLEVPAAWSRWGMDLGVMSPLEYVEFAATRIAAAVEKAWKRRKPGGVSFGLGHAVVGQNRLTSYYDGNSRMYGTTDRPDFSHIEGYEDHSVGLLYTWDAEEKLTGVAVNIACPSQASGGSRITADFWHETRIELRKRLGEDLFIFPQCSAAGDQSPSVLVDKRAEARMQRFTGRNRRQQIAVRIADAVTSVLPIMEKHIDRAPLLAHRMDQVELPRRRLTAEDIKTPRSTHHRPETETVEQAFDRLLGEYRKMREELEEHPQRKEKPGWYSSMTAVFWRLSRASRVLDRYELQQTQPTMPVEVHVVRLGDMAIATNPFELYLDYGVQIKARSKAVQTFVVELANGSGAGYLPTARSVAGGGYGAIPESTEIGPEGGRVLVEETLKMIDSLWDEK
ncbi:Neutral/alkaline non-lysosomal ceramidase [Novipirellula galeiformis]|uniref:Neutral/alkaline non-lysosomal ceramidase n=1 Tax=Novipirellula galeiformis TaxID=2528004 RepID=A0A5C6CQB5_9BACT|nr:neutral/alkaline non-lysosomal ceramidase N-terminal domain-containing protein [Novipirellula galeiformis]TWU25286.1 Neutral/alkaline non-lysosomal ceramidase [Novipirellula galeiformis]